MTAPPRDDGKYISHREGPAMPLALAAIGQEVAMVKVEGDHRLQLRLAEMGLMPGARFRVLAKGTPGPFIVSVRDTRLILGNGMVHRLRVAPM